MGSFHGLGRLLDPVPARLLGPLRRLDQRSGQAALYRRQLPRLLDHLRESARVESVEASSAIEGVVAPKARAEAVIRNPEEATRNRSEEELRGYSNALTYVIEEASTDHQLGVGLILHLHRLLYAPTGLVGAGQFKTTDNQVVERRGGAQRVRFTPVSAVATPDAVRDLVDTYNHLLTTGDQHPLIIAAAFVLDFTVIHPFADGNGRVSRLVTNLLLERSGYDVGRYVSIERIVERNRDRYYDALEAATRGWHDNEHDPWPWIEFLVEVVDTAYERFVTFAEAERGHGSKQERVRRHLEEHASRSFTMGDLRQALPGISDATIRKVLQGFRDQGLVEGSTGRGASWRWFGGSGVAAQRESE
ncbi:MAG: Fic family protein [Acidimicrobiales bacterium]